MFTQLFKRPKAVERYRTAPLAESRLSYLRHCAEEGAAQHTLRRIAAYQLIFVSCLDLVTVKEVRPEQIEDAADGWISRQPAYHSQKDARASRVVFIAQAKHWLRFLGRLHVPTTSAQSHAELIEEFARYMGQERGLSPLTIHTRRGRVAEFLTWSCGNHRTLQDLSILDIDAAIARKGAQGCTRASIQTYALVLRAFFRYAEMRGWCKPGLAAAIMPPRVYKGEALPYRKWKHRLLLEPRTFRTLLLLLYGAGLRGCEARLLKLSDVDTPAARLTIRDTKFYKTRLVPLGSDLNGVIAEYAEWRVAVHPVRNDDESLFVDRKGAPLQDYVVRRAFADLRIAAGVKRNDGARYQPRLHDLRHGFTVDRLTAWYREGKDVQKLLPALSTYLGHINIAATQVYLTMTPELLRQACRRFERYAFGEVEHE